MRRCDTLLGIGVDVGGTFTDLIVYNEKSGDINICKIPSDRLKPWSPIIQGIQSSIQDFKKIKDIRYGTTIGVNTIIEQRGSKTGLITTKSFRDLLEIARQKRPELYNLRAVRPRPIVTRDLRFTVTERVGADGRILVRLDEQEVFDAAKKLKQEGAEAVAILLLNSYINGKHEHKIASILKKVLPQIYLSVSSEVIPEFREYERLSTTVLNAYLGPIFKKYLTNLLGEIKKNRVESSFYISQSDGGITSTESAFNLPVRTLYSGPSAGVLGAAFFYGKDEKGDNFVTLDIGGTSTDIAFISKSKPIKTTEKEINGYPIKFPVIDVLTIGAGGGSIAEVDEGGFLQVGPYSSGAEPGPACYDKGGEKPTVTDANLILGILGIKTILGGQIKLNLEKAKSAIEKYISIPLKISLINSALSVIQLVISNVAEAIRAVSISKGIHPKNLRLIAYGGAGPMHAAEVARELGVREVIIPKNAGVFSALGLLCSNVTMDFVKTVKNIKIKSLSKIAEELKQKGDLWFEKEGIPFKKQKREWSADVRYYGQNYEINIPLSNPSLGEKSNYKKLKDAFHKKHFKFFRYEQKKKEIEIINLRLRCIGKLSIKFRNKYSKKNKTYNNSIKEYRKVYYIGVDKPIKTPVFGRDLLSYKTKVKGPAILEEIDSTTLILPGDLAVLNDKGDLIININKDNNF